MTNFLSNIFVSDSFAQTVDATVPASAGLMSFMPLILIFLVFYFLLIRPQQKKMKEHQNTLNNLKNGDKVYTNGGIFGVVKSINDKEIDLEIASDVVIKILKQNISDVVKDQSVIKKEPTKDRKTNKTNLKK